MKEKEIKREQIITPCVPCLDEQCESTYDSAEKLTINANKLSQWGIYKKVYIIQVSAQLKN